MSAMIDDSQAQEAPEVTGNKHDAGKARYDLFSPYALHMTALVLSQGATKYGDRNWELGVSYSRYYAALQRHLNAWFRGEACDPESGISHLGHAACCLMYLQHFEATGKYERFDDRPLDGAHPLIDGGNVQPSLADPVPGIDFGKAAL